MSVFIRHCDNRTYSLLLNYSKIDNYAGLVKWHHETFPKFNRGFDSRIPLH